MFYVYILKSSKTHRHYIGSTADIAKRLTAHNSGTNRSTKTGRPWEIICSEKYNSKAAAWQREQQIKRYKGGEDFKKLIGLI